MLGIDACKTGWVGIALSQEALGAYAAAEVSDLVEHAGSDGPLSVIAIDIPIGLPDTGRRQADLLVRNAVGLRWASVFIHRSARRWKQTTTLQLSLLVCA